MADRETSTSEIDEAVFRKVISPEERIQFETSLRLVVFDYDRTLTLETRNSVVNDYVSGWKGQIDPWRVLHKDGDGWDTYDDQFAAEGMTAEELKDEFNQGKHTSEAYMQQVMQDFLRTSFNDGERKPDAIPTAEFLQEEVHNPSKRLYHLKQMLETVRRGLDQQEPSGKIVIMTYNVWGAIFVLNTLIHADMSHYFDAIHSQLNAVEKLNGAWHVVRGGSRLSKRGSMFHVEGQSLEKIQVISAGKLDQGRFGKPEAVERLYEDCGGLASAILIDDESDNTSAWVEKGGRYLVDLSKVPGEHKLTIPWIEQATQFFETLLETE